MRDGLLILLVFALGVLIGRNLPDDAIRSVPEPAPDARPSPVADAATAAPETLVAIPARPAELPTPPLAAIESLPPAPPLGTPLVQSLPALQARAEAGDVEAATRWFREASICQWIDPLPRQGHRRPPSDAESAAKRCLQQRHCSSLPPERIQPLRALRLAALAGNDDAAVAYAALPLLFWINDPTVTTMARQWPAEAPVLLARARERGHAWAWLITAETLTVGRLAPPLRRLLPRDPASGLAMLWALQRVPQPGFELVEAMQENDWSTLAARLGIPDSALGAIRAEGDRIYRRHLHSTRSLSAEIEASQRLTMLGGMRVRDALPEVSPTCAAELAADPAWNPSKSG